MSKSGISIRFFLLVIGVGMVFTTPVALAEMYKWTDEDGVVHYSQLPPPADAGVPVTEIDPPPDVDTDKAIKELEADRQKLHKMQEERQKQQEKQAEKERIAAIFKRNCRLSRERLKTLETGPTRVRAVDAEGNVTRTSVEEHQARIDEVKKKIEKYCK